MAKKLLSLPLSFSALVCGAYTLRILSFNFTAEFMGIKMAAWAFYGHFRWPTKEL